MTQEHHLAEASHEVERSKEIYEASETIGFDADGVLFDLDGRVIWRVNSTHGTSYTVDEITEWHSVRNWLVDLGYPPKEAEVSQFRDYWENRELILSTPLIKGAWEMILACERDGKNAIVATSRQFFLEETTRLQLRRRLGLIRPENIHIRKAGDDDRKGFKGRVVRDRRIGLFFENDPLHIEGILEQTDIPVVWVPFYPRYEKQYPEIASSPRVIKLPYLYLLAQVLYPDTRIVL